MSHWIREWLCNWQSVDEIGDAVLKTELGGPGFKKKKKERENFENNLWCGIGWCPFTETEITEEEFVG